MLCGVLKAQPDPIFLWRGVEGMKDEKTRLYVYNNIPDSLRTGVSVIICPGGSYHHLGLKHEGYEVAEFLNSKGITAFVLRYRVGFNGYKYPAMIEDVQRAIQYVSDNSNLLGIDRTKIGVVGFSAGGHLVTMAASFHSTNLIKKYGITSNADLRPSFVVPVYPVVSMHDSIAHARSRRNLLGKNPCVSMIDSLSLEYKIPSDMPPTLIVATKDDPVVDPRNSVELDNTLKSKGITHKFLFYDTGGHGFGLGRDPRAEVSKWDNVLNDWLSEINIL